MAISTVASLNSLFNTIFEDAIFVAREQNLMTRLVTNFSANTMANRQMGIYPQITAQETSEGVDYNNPITFDKTSHMTLTPKIVRAQVIITDERVMTDPDEVRTDSALELGGAVGTKIDVDLVGLFSSFDNNVGAAGSALAISVVAAGVSNLRATPVPGPFSVVLHPHGWYDIWVELGSPALTASFLGDVANEALRQYFVGSFIGMNWFTNANITVDGTTDDSSGAVFHRASLAFDTRTPMEMETERDASLGATELNVVTRYAVGVRRANWGYEIVHDATAPTGF